jgi:hypothetical protein
MEDEPGRTHACQGVVGGGMRGGKAAFLQELPDFGQRLEGVRVGAVARTSVPERVFVELNVFAHHVAEDHGTQPPASYRQCAIPILFGRLVVPEFQWICSRFRYD